MFRTNLKMTAIAFIMSTGVFFTACKGKPKDTGNTTDNSTTVAPEQSAAARVEVANDDALSAGLKDATKDYPGVKAVANNGEVTLTGEIERSRLQNLMQSLNSLKAKKINNQLTIK